MMRLRDLRGRHALAAVWLAGVLDAAYPVAAKDLGVLGETWRIEEPDLLGRIEQQLVELERSGERARLDEEAKGPGPRAPGGAGTGARHRARPGIAGMAVRSGHHGAGEYCRSERRGDRRRGHTHRTPCPPPPAAGTAVHRRYPSEVEVEWALARVSPTTIVLLAGRPVRSVAGPRARILLRSDRCAHRAVRAQSHPDPDPPGRAEAPNNRNPAGRERPRNPLSAKTPFAIPFPTRRWRHEPVSYPVESRASCLHSCRTAGHGARSAPGGSSIP